jgi:endonuclease-8
MAEGDTILRAAQRIEAALGGEQIEVLPRERGRAEGLDRLQGGRLERVESRGKHLLFHLGDQVLHSHLGMNGSWRVARRGACWGRPPGAAWVVLRGEASEAVQFGGPTLRVLSRAKLANDPILSRLGSDVLDGNVEIAGLSRSLRSAAGLELGEALLDQRLVAGIGNIFKSEACFAARVSPWRRVGELTEEELAAVLGEARRLMEESVARGRPRFTVYRGARRPCPRCGTQISSRGQGDANRRTYWCPSCQPSG